MANMVLTITAADAEDMRQSLLEFLGGSESKTKTASKAKTKSAPKPEPTVEPTSELTLASKPEPEPEPAAPHYTLEDLGRAGAKLISDKLVTPADLTSMLKNDFGVQAITQIADDLLPDLAERLIAMGADLEKRR